MSLSSELSSEIAAALFSDRARSPNELRTLKKTILEVHAALIEMERQAQKERLGVDRKLRLAERQLGDVDR